MQATAASAHDPCFWGCSAADCACRHKQLASQADTCPGSKSGCTHLRRVSRLVLVLARGHLGVLLRRVLLVVVARRRHLLQQQREKEWARCGTHQQRTGVPVTS